MINVGIGVSICEASKDGYLHIPPKINVAK